MLHVPIPVTVITFTPFGLHISDFETATFPALILYLNLYDSVTGRTRTTRGRFEVHTSDFETATFPVLILYLNLYD